MPLDVLIVDDSAAIRKILQRVLAQTDVPTICRVDKGEFLGIVGKSGTGKSTLLNMITGVDHLTSGEVVVRGNGEDISVHQLDEDTLALWRGQTLGIIFQSFQLLPMLTLIENVMMPIDLCGDYQSRLSRERAMELLMLVELEDHANKLPAYISGGQQQTRCDCARLSE